MNNRSHQSNGYSDNFPIGNKLLVISDTSATNRITSEQNNKQIKCPEVSLIKVKREEISRNNVIEESVICHKYLRLKKRFKEIVLTLSIRQTQSRCLQILKRWTSFYI